MSNACIFFLAAIVGWLGQWGALAAASGFAGKSRPPEESTLPQAAEDFSDTTAVLNRLREWESMDDTRAATIVNVTLTDDAQSLAESTVRRIIYGN